MSPVIPEMKSASRRFIDLDTLNYIDLEIAASEIITIRGRHGSGKSVLSKPWHRFMYRFVIRLASECYSHICFQCFKEAKE